jgi:gamma-glutamyl hercynylcysteine S-oxide synthase
VKLQDHIRGVEPRAPGPTPHCRAGQTVTPSGGGFPPARPAVRSHSGWAARLFGWIAPLRSRPRASHHHPDFPPLSCGQGDGTVPGAAPHRSRDEIPGITKRLINDDRYAFVLLKETVDQISDRDTLPAWNLLHEQMALIPAGRVPVVLCDGSVAISEVAGFFLDRLAVSNRQFRRFVQSGGYESLEIWPQEVWPSVSRFSDRTGRPGPRDWEDGNVPPGKADHPVVGICWFEAMAYARWVGKRLPTAAEWQKAGGWPDQLSGGGCNRYPWGDLFDPARTNLAQAQIGGTVPVSALPNGATPNGIYQMTGNVWEWLDDPLEAIPCDADHTFVPWKPMRRIIGGAYNTYFANEATCHYITGQGEFDRRDNIGFRCAVPADALRPLPAIEQSPLHA